MREYPYQLNDALLRGLRKQSRGRRTEPGLAECLNLRVRPGGLEFVGAPVFPVGDLEASAWPFPMLHVGRETILLAYSNAIYEVDWLAQTMTLLATYDAQDTEETKDITDGGVWHFMDFGLTWMLLNQACVVYKTNAAGMLDGENKVLVQETPSFFTGCAHRGRGVFGGLSSELWTEEWRTFWASETAELTPEIERTMAMRENMVLWTSIGGGDLTFWASLGVAKLGPFGEGGGYSADWPMLWDMLKRNEWGFAPMPFNGPILKVLPMGDKVIVYGAHGVAALYLASAQATYGILPILHVGIAERGCAAGDERGHIFMDQAGFLWALGPDLKVERLDYHEFLYPLVQEGNIAISHDPQEDEFWISTENDGYLLTKNGLARVGASATSAAPHEGVLAGIAFVNENTADGLLVVTDAIDMGIRDIKQIQTVEVAFQGLSDVEVAVDWRMNGGEWTRSPWVPVCDAGFANVSTAGVELRIAVRGTIADQTARIDGLTARWKLASGNAAHGPFAIPGMSR